MNRRGFIGGSAALATAILSPACNAAAAVANPDLNAIAQRIVEETMQKLATATPTPVILLLGEFHNQPKHIITQIIVLKELQKRGMSFSVGLELPHDELFKSFSKHAHGDWQNWDRTKIESIKAHDPLGHHALKSAALWQESTGLDSHRMLWKFLIESGISTQFNDVAWSPGNGMKRIDLRDPATLAMIGKVFGRDFMTMPLSSPEGLLLRNHFIGEACLRQAEKFETPLVVQICGSGHITGAASPPRPFRDSLPVILKDKGMPFIAAPFLIDTETGDIAADYKPADYGIITDIVLPYENGGERKIEFIRSVLAASGLSPAMAEVEPHLPTYQKELGALFARWRIEANPAGAPAP